eukprot:CAMPEP_0114593814 /NCGR_PEP_ID=MMETSP0125-20121206/15412_1 /TAXON_ID=485358 ORGANISM="Aristerostoma sp., Strain ATCC 50986" /NCGR_SAMPLE_ID=MMETSP0125 /ASSEMBLY_ACC=CAM_ASM_000245 /LENGTH=40 /DNA_ID= /DNA_START= /DNA_END= /DNA_ORIENTATION=
MLTGEWQKTENNLGANASEENDENDALGDSQDFEEDDDDE